MWRILYTKEALKDFDKLKLNGNPAWLTAVLEIEALLGRDPWERPPAYKQLAGQLRGLWSRRITLEHRFIYQIFSQDRAVKVISVYGHFT